MWWAIPFGVLLGGGAVFLVSSTTDLLVKHLPLELSFTVMAAMASLVPITRPMMRAVGKWLTSKPRHEPVRLRLDE
jgi:hypothetical protein